MTTEDSINTLKRIFSCSAGKCFNKSEVTSYKYVHGNNEYTDFRIVVNNIPNIREFEAYLSGDKEKLDHIFSKHVIVFWLLKCNKKIKEIFSIIDFCFVLIKRDDLISDNKYYCYITKESVCHLPIITNRLANTTYVLPIIERPTCKYILLRRIENYYAMFGGKVSPANNPVGFALKRLEEYMHLTINNKNEVKETYNYTKDIVYPVLDKTIKTRYTCYYITLDDSSLKDHDINNILESNDADLILKEEFVLIKFNKTGNLSPVRDDVCSVATNVPKLVRMYASSEN